MKFKNLPQPLSPATAARRNQHVANFRAGQQAYNQLITNLLNIQRLKEEQARRLRQNKENASLIQQIQHRLTWYPASLRGSEQRKSERIGVQRTQRTREYFNTQTRIRNIKRRVLNVLPPRFRPWAHHIMPYNIHVLNQWYPNEVIAALKLGSGRKISKSGLNYATRPHGKTSMNLFARSNANIAGLLKRKRSSPRRNAGQ
jgi:hypothetical protein